MSLLSAFTHHDITYLSYLSPPLLPPWFNFPYYLTTGQAPNYFPNSFSGPMDTPSCSLSKTTVVCHVILMWSHENVDYVHLHYRLLETWNVTRRVKMTISVRWAITTSSLTWSHDLGCDHVTVRWQRSGPKFWQRQKGSDWFRTLPVVWVEPLISFREEWWAIDILDVPRSNWDVHKLNW